MDQLLLIFDTFGLFFSVLSYLWWVYLPVLLFFLAYIAIQNYTNLKYRLGLEWVLLEIKASKESRKSPKAMEQIFAGLHGIYAVPVVWRDKFFKGRMLDWYSFEMVGKGGETHFYIRTLSKYRNIVEAQIYAHYPDAEVAEAVDYVNDMPLLVPDEKYDLWGTDMMLAKEDAYPIRTYPDFEEKAVGIDDVKRIDPLASISELFSTLHPGEQLWLQIVATPVGDYWVKEGQKVIDKLMGKTPPPEKGNFLAEAVFAIDRAITGAPAQPEKKEEKRADISPGKQELLKAVERSLDKVGYQAGLRFIYVAEKENFHQAHVAGVMGALRQFTSQNLNSFKPNLKTLTFAKGLFKASKLFRKKRIIYQAYRERRITPVKSILNTEELATIFHFPDIGVKSPLLPRVEAKKGEPPVGLPLS